MGERRPSPAAVTGRPTGVPSGAGTRAASGAGPAAKTGFPRGAMGPHPQTRQRPEPPRQPTTDIFKMGRLLLTSREPALRAFAARALGNAGRKTAYAFLRKALLDPEETVIRSAVSSIGKLSIMQSAGELAALYARSGTAVRRDVLLCVGSILPRQAARMPSFDGFTAIARIAAGDAEPDIRALASRLLRDGV